MTAEVQCLNSPWLGEIEWSSAVELDFPAGLPGFEAERRILPVEIPAQRPLMYLQSLDHPDICFVALPVLAVSPEFALRLSEDDAVLLGLPLERIPAIGADVLCLAMLVPLGDTVQANLDAPVVINLHRGIGAQCVLPGGRVHGHFALREQGWVPLC